MNLSKIFEGEIKKDKIAKAKKVNVRFLSDLKKKAKDDFEENVGQNWAVIEEFVAGDQWKNQTIKRSKLAFNSLGETVYDFETTYGRTKDGLSNKPKRVVNITKSAIDSLVSVFAEVYPKPVAIAYDDYTYDEELLKKINLLLSSIFEKENNFNSMYKVVVEGGCEYGHYFLQISIDPDKTKGQIPLKFKYINPKLVYVDPEAVTLDEADYIIQTVKMKYWQLKDNYDYVFKPIDENMKERKEPDDFDVVEVDQYWIRFKKSDKIQWLLIPIYDNKWLRFKEDNKENILIFDDLPLQIFRDKIRERWFGESLVLGMMPAQVEYNKVVSEQDWNWMKVIEPPTKGNADVQKVKEANIPGGHMNLKANEDVTTMGNVTLIPAGEFQARLDTIQKQMESVIGNVDVMQGRRPTGVYSAKMLETLQKAAQLKPKMMEEEFLHSVTELAEKSLRLYANYLGGGTVYLFDPTTGSDVAITRNDIENGLYRVKVDTKDANLLTKEARFEIIKDMLQYAKIQEYMPMYYLIRSINASIPGIFPDEVESLLKKDYDDFKEQKIAQAQTQQVTAGVPSPTEGGGPGLPPTPATPPPVNNEIPEMNEDEFNSQVANYQMQLEQGGVQPEYINNIMKMAVDDELAQGTSKEEILMILEELVNKTLNITGA